MQFHILLQWHRLYYHWRWTNAAIIWSVETCLNSLKLRMDTRKRPWWRSFVSALPKPETNVLNCILTEHTEDPPQALSLNPAFQLLITTSYVLLTKSVWSEWQANWSTARQELPQQKNCQSRRFNAFPYIRAENQIPSPLTSSTSKKICSLTFSF